MTKAIMTKAMELARACAQRMWAEDAVRKSLGMQLVSVEPGRAVLTMTVGDAMLNGHGLCHGGTIFTLADSAFAFASNSYDQRTVAAHCSITFVNSARLGDRLVARAIERQRSGRSGIYDVSVAREDGTVIAEFRGLSRTVKSSVLKAG